MGGVTLELSKAFESNDFCLERFWAEAVLQKKSSEDVLSIQWAVDPKGHQCQQRLRRPIACGFLERRREARRPLSKSRFATPTREMVTGCTWNEPIVLNDRATDGIGP